MSGRRHTVRLRRCQLLGGAVFAAALMTWAVALPHAQGTRTVRDGVFSEAQAARGKAIYEKQCASCHGNALEGSQGPPLVADAFVGNWQSQPLSALVNKVRNTMPADAPGDLTMQQSSDLVAHILKTDRLPGGRSGAAVRPKRPWPESGGQQRPAAAPARRVGRTRRVSIRRSGTWRS